MATEPFIGTMTTFGGTFTIENWAMCVGQIQAISENTALFSLLGAQYGGDARSTFGLPDLRGRSPVGHGQMPGGQDYRQGFKMGREFITLTVPQMPSHTHTAVFTASGGTAASGSLQVATNPASTGTPTSDTYIGANTSPGFFKPGLGGADLVEIKGLNIQDGGSGGGTVTNLDTGSSSPINIVNPVLPLNWLIALQGVYPSRA